MKQKLVSLLKLNTMVEHLAKLKFNYIRVPSYFRTYIGSPGKFKNKYT